MNPKAKPPSAFALLDLLITVTLLALLATLLVPSLGRARSTNATDVCARNTLAIIGATVQYAQDNNNSLPHPNWGFNRTYAGWLCKPPYTSGQTNIQSGLLWPYLKTAKVYRCPSDKTNAPAFLHRKQNYTSYIMNGAACFFEDQPAPRTAAISALPPDAILFWQADERNFRDYNDGASRPDEGSTRLHNGKSPVGILDGSVEKISVRDFNTEALRRPGRLWWNPKTKDGSG